ncbi:uncharacterized protein LOC113552887 isoform X1 [Rhopalosiphum maidis]|uniref:uncharacterized protein LOC113552887 isoform X1 n=1 Tax=Rhopalosiphum maidis TaxID=43146 RepID=UPI000F003BD0|nr:uncharacterized protein LOC113552887 isoform X1 [Rhopalosiphum maidis]
MTITPVQWVCCGIVLLVALCSGGRQYGTRKIRHDHKGQDEGTQSDIDFEFETTKGFQFDNGGDYNDPSEEGITLDVVHSLYDTRKGVVPNIIYQVRMNCSAAASTLYNYTITMNGRLLARGGQPDADGGCNLLKFDWSVTTADQQSHKYLTFKLEYSTLGAPDTNQFKKRIQILKDCELYMLAAESGRLSSRDLPLARGQQQQQCVVRFVQRHRARLVVDVVKLNVPCKRGRLQVFGHQPVCGKLEDLREADRHYVLDAGRSPPPTITSTVGRYAFSIVYRLAANCFDNDVAQQNGTVVFTPGSECRYKVTQPYGYRLRLLINSVPFGHQTADADVAVTADYDHVATTAKPMTIDTLPIHQSTTTCPGTLFRLTDGAVGWFYCAPVDGPKRQMSMVSETNVVLMESSSASMHVPTLVVSYRAEPIPEVVSQCPYGSVSLRAGRCLTIINELLNWEDAEEYCTQNGGGGHLASIDSHRTQMLIDTILINSPSYSDNAPYWIGATDMNNEGFFKWTDSSPFTYSNWYQGHIHQPYSGPNSKQPNDDGLSRQDCVELRQVYRPQNRLLKYFNRNSSYTWNDRDCSVKNRFLCQTQQHTSLNDYDPDESSCNVTMKLTSEMRFASVSSPGFPQPYPDNQDCTFIVEVPRGYQIEVEFEELMLENESTCSYDYVELIPGDDDEGPKHCGDKSDILKLTRFVTRRTKLRIHFVSDYSHSFSGFKARVSAEHVNNECDDARQQMFNGSCYLFASYPEVSWHTAKSICNGIKAELTSVHNAEEEQFVESFIRESTESRSAIYWLGGTWNDKSWYWVDNSTETFSAWLATDTTNAMSYKDMCLAISWLSSPPVNLPRGLYWTANDCNTVGGYICKKNQTKLSDQYNLNTTMSGVKGIITSLNYPANYYHNLDYWIHVIGPYQSRIVFQFDSINIEPQSDCLYDFVAVVEPKERENRTMTVCGYRGSHLEDYIFVTDSNEAFVHFHSDYSVSSSGFHLLWNTVDMSGCPSQTLSALEGQVVSPNYPNFILPNLNCVTMILAPVGHRIWIDFVDYNLDESQTFKLYLSRTADNITPFRYRNSINDGAFLSEGESVNIEYSTNRMPRGRGFKIAYKMVVDFDEERAIVLENDTSGFMYRLNYPLPMHFPKLRYKQRLLASIGQNIQLQFNRVVPAQMDTALGRTVCPGQQSTTVIEIHDHYAAENGTWWLLCENTEQPKSVPISITSFLNSMSVVVVYGQKPAMDIASANISVNVKPDAESKKKLVALAKIPETANNTRIESCKPNPCVNGGTCVIRKATHTYHCKCHGNYTGTFCSLTYCDLGYCVFGECVLAGSNGFECKCQYGYMGRFCDKKIKPCELNPCKDRGDCVSLGDSDYQCRCYAYWTGDQCERKVLHITYKPLTERMLQEPFWLGLLTVFVVMGILGIIWCAKRHVPEKIEKILSEEAERSRHFTVNASGRMSSVRGELLVPTVKTNGATPSEGGNSPPPQPKTFLRRLGIRKPSLMSLTSPLQTGRTARTFSLDDLLRPQVPRFNQYRAKQKSASPSKFRTTIADKSEILQQLISPGLERQASFNDEINLVDKLSTNNIGPNDILLPQSNISQETSFSNDCSIDEAVQKIEKKVTFARLMNKFQSEMSSTSSEVEAQSKRTLRRPCPNQGSDSLSSLEGVLENRNPNTLSLNQYQQQTGQKAMSADSILAMFRNFNTAMAMTEMSNYLSASTTPSCSSLQDEVVGSEDESLMSNTVHSPSGGKESPTRYRYSNVIQLPVVDMLSSQRNNSNNPLNSLQHPPSILLEVPNYRMDCLSPIHELPTPAPSPSPTPIISRKSAFSCLKDIDDYRHHQKQQEPPSLQVPTELPTAQAKQLTIPTLVIQQPTPINSPSMEFPGSPPPHKERPLNRKMLKDMEKPISLDLPAPPPVITVTCMSDSDTESVTTKNGTDSSKNGGGMCYLSPFSMCSRADRIASESNLSSSGYSSGPSRCNSNTRLCPLDCGEEPRRISPLIHTPEIREMDSETTFSENDDEGFDTETAEPKTDHHHYRNTELEAETQKSGLTTTSLKVYTSGSEPEALGRHPQQQQQPVPSITVQQYPSTLHLSTDMLYEKSPVSSRSESPLSDKTVFRFSPMFYGRITDSDSIYDFTSSDCAMKKRTGKKRERKRRHFGGGGSIIGGSACTTPSETLAYSNSALLLDVPGRNDRKKSRSKPNTRRRSRSQQTIVPSSSSSTDSLNDTTKVSYSNRHKRSNDSVKRNLSSENWSDRGKSGEDKKAVKKKTKSNRTENRRLRFQNKTVSDQGHYESAHDEESVSNFASLPSLLSTDNRGAVLGAEIAITNNKCKFTTARFQKRVIASD